MVTVMCWNTWSTKVRRKGIACCWLFSCLLDLLFSTSHWLLFLSWMYLGIKLLSHPSIAPSIDPYCATHLNPMHGDLQIWVPGPDCSQFSHRWLTKVSHSSSPKLNSSSFTLLIISLSQDWELRFISDSPITFCFKYGQLPCTTATLSLTSSHLGRPSHLHPPIFPGPV